MSDFDKNLRQTTAAPRRPLRTDFTANVITRLEAMDQNSKKRPKWMQYLNFRLPKPALAGLAISAAILLGGTAYAAVGGMSGIKALFGGQTSLTDGSRIVKVDTQNCPHVEAFNVTSNNRSINGSYYYKINPSANLTNDQVVEMVQGACEADAEAVANGNLVQQLEAASQNTNDLVGDYADSVITSIGPDHVTVSYALALGSSQGNYSQVIHAFTKIDPNVIVVSQGARQTYDSLKVGDHVAIVYRATGDALLHSEGISPDKIDAGAQTVVVITKVSSHMEQYYQFQKYNRNEFEQVTPCSKTASGFCTVEEYYQK